MKFENIILLALVADTANAEAGLRRKLPKCQAEDSNRIGDGWCDGGFYNTDACGWDGGDCCFGTCHDNHFACGSSGYDCLDPNYCFECASRRKTQEVGLCGVATCTQEVLDAMACNDSLAGCHSCGSRIKYVIDSWNFSERDACQLVAGDQFPDACGLCQPQIESALASTQGPAKNPTRTPTFAPTQDHTKNPTRNPTFAPTQIPTLAPPTQESVLCGVATCTQEVLDALACDGSLAGCHHSCGSRINYVIDSWKFSERDACQLVAGDQFPSVCGLCQPEVESTPALAQGPTLNPPMQDISCGVATCTHQVLDAMACDESLGGCHPCGSRISYLIENSADDETMACKTVADQFRSVCGLCRPEIVLPSAPPVDPTKLVWSDDFDVDGLPDSSKWGYDLGGHGWGNQELQHYTDRYENAFVSNGVLNIRAVREDYEDSSYTSARLITKYKGDWTYGRVQVRARLLQCKATGTWAAIWMLPTDWTYGGWPASGEIDIMEHVGYDEDYVIGSVHTEAFNHMIGTQRSDFIHTSVDEWHVYDILWDEEHIEFNFDGLKYHEFRKETSSTYKEWPFDQDFHLLLNVAVGGSWGGQEGVNASAFEGDGQIMEVDWVRIYSI